MISRSDPDVALLDAILRDGMTASGGDAALALLLADIVDIAESPAPAPSAALAAMFAADAASQQVVASLPTEGRHRLVRVLRRIASLGVAAKISLAAVAAGAAITTAGVTHSLPGS